LRTFPLVQQRRLRRCRNTDSIGIRGGFRTFRYRFADSAGKEAPPPPKPCLACNPHADDQPVRSFTVSPMGCTPEGFPQFPQFPLAIFEACGPPDDPSGRHDGSARTAIPRKRVGAWTGACRRISAAVGRT